MSGSDKITASKQDTLSLSNNKGAGAVDPKKPGCGSPDSSVTPQRLIVALGLLAGVLDVDSVLVDKNQQVEIVLVGTLKQKFK